MTRPPLERAQTKIGDRWIEFVRDHAATSRGFRGALATRWKLSFEELDAAERYIAEARMIPAPAASFIDRSLPAGDRD